MGDRTEYSNMREPGQGYSGLTLVDCYSHIEKLEGREAAIQRAARSNFGGRNGNGQDS